MSEGLGSRVVLALLDWPVLAFLAVVGFVLLFRKQLAAALRQGDVLLSWGANSIKLSQLSGNLDKELDPIRDELQALKNAVAALERGASADAPPVLPPEPAPASVQAAAGASERMLEALRDPHYVWRSIERLATIGGVSEVEALDLLRQSTDVVTLGLDKSGRRIARLRTPRSTDLSD
jgi:hypothetical protein